MSPFRAAVFTVLLGSFGLSVAQAPVDNAPVTSNEARKVLDKIQTALGKVVSAKGLKPSKLPSSGKPVTREQVVLELTRMATEFRPYYSNKPRTQYSNPSAIHLTGTAKVDALKLVKLGFVEPVGALVVGPKPTLTPQQFAEALGFFVARWCDATHQPSMKFSPSLMSDGSTPKLPSGSKVRVPSGAAPQPPSSSR